MLKSSDNIVLLLKYINEKLNFCNTNAKKTKFEMVEMQMKGQKLVDNPKNVFFLFKQKTKIKKKSSKKRS